MIKTVQETLDKTWVFDFTNLRECEGAWILDFCKYNHETNRDFDNRVMGMVARMRAKHAVTAIAFDYKEGIAQVTFS